MRLSPELTAEVLALAAGRPTAAGSLESVTLPIPPSTNHLFFTKGRRRIKSAEYRAWTSEVLPILRRLARVAPPVEIEVTVCGKVNAQRDLDNMLKPIGDALVESGVIENDNVRHVTAWNVRARLSPIGAPEVRVRLRPDTGE